MKTYYVYLISSISRVVYTGVTNDLQRRVAQHKARKNPNSFSARYRINRLVYFESFNCIAQAIAREKELKGWKRERKIALIESTNPMWQDLSAAWED